MLEVLLEVTEALGPGTQPVPASASTSGPRLKRTGRDFSQEAQQPHLGYKRQRQDVLRPGIPPPTNPASWVYPDRPEAPFKPDDKDGHYQFELGENLTSRYKVLSKMGEGTFGRVLECWDRKHKDYVAIKIVRNIDKYRHAAMIELEVLNTLERNDQRGSRHCIALREWFDYRGHVCMVFEKLGPSLFDFLRKNEYRPFPLDLVQEFSRQLLESVAYLHELQLVHTDLKPENILLVSLDFCRSSPITTGRPPMTRVVPASSAIKVIDFGSATFDDQHHSSIVSTRHYRAPEVILSLGWSFPCDLWSIGCIMVELLTGDALFQTHENMEHLAMMEQVLGPMPESMAADAVAKGGSKYFANNRLLWPQAASTKKSIKAVAKLKSLRRHILEHGDSSAVAHIDTLVDLISRMLRYNPEDRIQAQDALMHPFFGLRLPPSIPPPLPSSQLLQVNPGALIANSAVPLGQGLPMQPANSSSSMPQQQQQQQPWMVASYQQQPVAMQQQLWSGMQVALQIAGLGLLPPPGSTGAGGYISSMSYLPPQGYVTPMFPGQSMTYTSNSSASTHFNGW